MADAEAKLRISAENRTKVAFDEIKRSVAQVEAATTGLKSTFATLGAIGLGGFAITEIAGRLKETFANVVNVGDELNKMSQKVGVSVEALSELSYAGSLADVSVESLKTGLTRLSVAVTETNAGTGEAKDAFTALGISVRDANGQIKTNQQVLTEIADRFSQMEDGATKSAIAVKIFGRSGVDLVPLLNQGAAGLKANADEARRYGLIISGDVAKASEEFNDNLTRLKASSEGLARSIAQPLIPVLNTFIQRLLTAKEVGSGVFDLARLLGQNTGSSGQDILNEIDKAQTKLDALKKKREELVENKGGKLAWQQALTGSNDLDKVDADITKAEQRIEFLRRLGSKLKSDTSLDAEDSGIFRRPLDVKYGDEAGKNVEQAKKQAEELKKAFAEVQELGRSLGISDEVMVTWPRKSKEDIDALKRVLQEGRKDWIAYADAVFTTAEAQDSANGSGQSFTQWAEALRDRVLDNIEPTRAWQRELADLKVLLDTGYLSIQQFNQASFNPRLRELISPIKDDFTLLNEALKEGDITLEQYTDAVVRLRGEVDKTKDVGEDFGFTFESAFERAAIEGEKLSEVLKGLEKDLARMILRKSVTEPLGDAIGKTIKDSGFDLGSIFGGKRAGGGPVEAGMAYIVGEKRPELFIPETNGTILPSVPSGGSGGGVTVQQNIRIDSRTDQATISMMVRRAADLAKAEILQSRRAGGRAFA